MRDRAPKGWRRAPAPVRGANLVRDGFRWFRAATFLATTSAWHEALTTGYWPGRLRRCHRTLPAEERVACKPPASSLLLAVRPPSFHSAEVRESAHGGALPRAPHSRYGNWNARRNPGMQA